MSNYNELVTILKELLFNRFYPKPQYIRGLLGDGRGNVLVPERPDYNYVRFSRASSETFEVFNKEVSQPVDGLPVLLGEYPWQEGLFQVVSVDWSAYAQTGWGDEWAGIQAHAPTHEWPNFAPGSDALNTYLRAITPMRTQASASGSTSVMVTAYEYDGGTGTNYGWPGVPELALGAATPATGTMRYMGVYLNPATNTLGVVTGSTTIFTDALEPPRPNWPRGVMPTAYVRLYGGQSQINERDIRDARRLWNNTLIYTGALGPHNLLSQFHPDTLTANVVAGDLIYGSSTPKWTRLPIVTGSYLGSLAGTPTWTNVTQLAAPDGNPNPALWVGNSGETRTATSTDIYIAGDEAGTKQRNVDIYESPILDHFDVGFTGFSWGAYAGFVTPANIDMSIFPSTVNIWNSTAQGAARAFAYTASVKTNISCRTVPTLEQRAGLRMDDGTNSNYFELFIEPSSGVTLVRYRYASAGVVTGPTTIFTLGGYMYTALRLQWAAGTGFFDTFYSINSPRFASIFRINGLGFTPTRSGLYHENTTASTSVGRASIFDWFNEQ